MSLDRSVIRSHRVHEVLCCLCLKDTVLSFLPLPDSRRECGPYRLFWSSGVCAITHTHTHILFLISHADCSQLRSCPAHKCEGTCDVTHTHAVCAISLYLCALLCHVCHECHEFVFHLFLSFFLSKKDEDHSGVSCDGKCFRLFPGENVLCSSSLLRVFFFFIFTCQAVECRSRFRLFTDEWSLTSSDLLLHS
jgi:hypothetical protein